MLFLVASLNNSYYP